MPLLSILSSIYSVVKSVLAKIPGNVKAGLLLFAVVAVLIAILFAKLHGAEDQVEMLSIALAELKAQAAVAVIQSKIDADNTKLVSNNSTILSLTAQTAAIKNNLTKTYQSKGLSNEEIASRFSKLNIG